MATARRALGPVPRHPGAVLVRVRAHDVFGLSEHPSAANADALYDQLVDALAQDAFRPRALFERFGIAVLATTDDPADDLPPTTPCARTRPSGRVLPTFRADRYMDPSAAGWTATSSASLVPRTSTRPRTPGCSRRCGRAVRRSSRRAGPRRTRGCSTPEHPVDPSDAERIHAAGLRGDVSPADAVAYRRNMLFRLAEMSAQDGLVMQLHPGVIRSHHAPTLAAFGPDTGHDLPDTGAFTRPLTPILEAFGTDPTFRLVLFTVDETTFSREIAPLAGFYPSVYAGAPWWFLDSPAAIWRYRQAVTDSAGFTKTSGFIDDTRAYCSIPARHDMSRRLDAAYLASLVATHQISEDDALGVARRLVDEIPRATFRLG